MEITSWRAAFRLWTHSFRIPTSAFRVGAAAFFALATGLARADNPPDKKTQEALEKKAQEMGSWDSHNRIIESAWDNVFTENGWDSEEDRYVREMMRQVERIPPWEQQKRQDTFLQNVRGRYGLDSGQCEFLDQTIRMEGQRVAAKHLATALPIAFEVLGTRAKNLPFSAEQVQDWAYRLEPIMKDAKGAIDVVASKLRGRLTPEQRALLDKDVKALDRRHHDIMKKTKDWQQGNWKPTDWGLQNDPIHAAAVADEMRQRAEKHRAELMNEAAQGLPKDQAMARNVDAWEKYVLYFCQRYECDEKQRESAYAILRRNEKTAVEYRASKKQSIEQAEQMAARAANKEKFEYYSKEAQDLYKLIAARNEEIFNAMCEDLERNVLTTEQQNRFKSQANGAAESRQASSAVQIEADKNPKLHKVESGR